MGNDGCRGYIYHLAINDQYRRQGIATVLVKQDLNSLKKLNIHKVALVVFKDNVLGNEFWQKTRFYFQKRFVIS